jgi:hypothetical protein
MPIGGGRLGFFYLQDRGMVSKKSLVFYDPLTNGPGGDTNYYASGDVTPAEVYAVIQTREAALGFTTTFVQSYSALQSYNLSEYAHIWDVGYASPYASNPDDPTAQLTTYLQDGGAMFILGENSNFEVRDTTIDDFLTALGGGTVVISNSDFNYAVDTTMDPQFLLANNNNIARFSRPGGFTSIGTATAMTTQFTNGVYVAAMWKTTSLSEAPRGAVVSVLDVNFLVGSGIDTDFIDNVIYSMNLK